MNIAQSIVLIGEMYLAAGMIFAVLFLTIGIVRIDEAARGTSLQFRAFIFPGCVILWPLLLRRWIKGPIR